MTIFLIYGWYLWHWPAWQCVDDHSFKQKKWRYSYTAFQGKMTIKYNTNDMVLSNCILYYIILHYMNLFPIYHLNKVGGETGHQFHSSHKSATNDIFLRQFTPVCLCFSSIASWWSMAARIVWVIGGMTYQMGFIFLLLDDLPTNLVFYSVDQTSMLEMCCWSLNKRKKIKIIWSE